MDRVRIKAGLFVLHCPHESLCGDAITDPPQLNILEDLILIVRVKWKLQPLGFESTDCAPRPISRATRQLPLLRNYPYPYHCHGQSKSAPGAGALGRTVHALLGQDSYGVHFASIDGSLTPTEEIDQ